MLLEKTPMWWKVPINELHAALTTFNDTDATRSGDGGGTGADNDANVDDSGSGVLATVTPVYVVMYRPICLSMLSSHFRRHGNAKYINGTYHFAESDHRRSIRAEQPAPVGSRSSSKRHQGRHETDEERFAKFMFEVDEIGRTIDKVEWALQTPGVNMAAFSYAELLWRPKAVSSLLKRILPCTSDGIYDSNFIPEIGKNIFEGNKFKPKGTVKAYGDSHPPTEMSFNLSTGYATGLC